MRNKRPTWDLNVTQPVAGNYYPVTSAAFMEVRPGSGRRAGGSTCHVPAKARQQGALVSCALLVSAVGNHRGLVLLTRVVCVQDDKLQFAVVTDRAQGAASLASGQMEFLLHFRRACRRRRSSSCRPSPHACRTSQ